MYYQQLRLYTDTRPMTSRTMPYLHLNLSASVFCFKKQTECIPNNYTSILTHAP